MPQKKETLKSIRTNLLTRGFSLAKASIKAGSLAANQWLHTSEDGGGGKAWLGQVEALVSQLGELKGTAMKVGQTLSMYGEHLLPKEANDVLKKLQQNSVPLAWEAVYPVVLEELGAEKVGELDIDPVALASASIGQVHKARIRATGEVLALKVQYAGIDHAVDTDLKLLKFMLNLSDLVPRGPRFDQIFQEIREMFLQEIDYRQELAFGERFGELLKDDARFLVPRFYPRYSTRKVIASQFIHGFRADAPEVQNLSQARRNRIGEAFFDAYMRELFEFQLMQTDPHLGNYLVEIDANGERDCLVLFDFGAVRAVPDEFLKNYRLLVEGGLHLDKRLVEKGGRELGLLQPEDDLGLVENYVNLCCMLTEPFQNGAYDWGQSDLPKRVAANVTKMAGFKVRAPPRELIFLDRKLSGVFIYLSVLKCVMDLRPNVARWIAPSRA